MLEYGPAQVVIAVVFLVVVVVIVAAAAVIAGRSARPVPLERVQRTGYGIRRPWLGFLVALLVVAVGASFFGLPYAGGQRPASTVRVSAGQFFFTIVPGSVPVDTPVRFEVTSVDVNHGFGVYDPDGRMLGSVQAMPGYTNELDLTFAKPGRYRVLCLEYCGLNHHEMQAAFDVVDG